MQPVPLSVNVIRPTPENSQEALLPSLVPLQPTPPEQPALTPLPEADVPEPSCPPPMPQTLTIPEGLAPVDSTLPLASIPSSDVLVPDTSSPDAIDRDSFQALPEPSVPQKRKRASSVRPSASIAVPDSGVRTRSVSLAARFPAGPQTRSVSRSRTPSFSRGEKRQGGDSGDDQEWNKRRKA